jgi:hypothetical protein
MRRRRKRLPVPQHEFGFAPETFNLIQETGIDGERLCREQTETARARENADALQTKFVERGGASLLSGGERA